MLQGLVSAFRTLTIFALPGRESADCTAALPFFPVVGCVLGLLLWLMSLSNALVNCNGWPAGVAALMLLASVVGTGALHLDGLADLADALGGGWNRERRLEIMKDSHLGTFGAVALIVVLLCKWLAFSRLVIAGSTFWVVLVLMVSRAMLVDLTVRLPYARSEAGTAGALVHGASARHRLAARAFTAVVAVVVYGPLGLGALVAAHSLTWLFGNWCLRTLGGITGDLLGAGNELVETTLLLLTAAPGSAIMVYTGWGWLFP
ncbi:MAG: adenosylcobinamide-GDP ribazoletransferase [Syntrophobacteria bacterium]